MGILLAIAAPRRPWLGRIEPRWTEILLGSTGTLFEICVSMGRGFFVSFWFTFGFLRWLREPFVFLSRGKNHRRGIGMGFSVSSSSSSPRKKYLFYGQELINYPFELDWIWNKIFLLILFPLLIIVIIQYWKKYQKTKHVYLSIFRFCLKRLGNSNVAIKECWIA